MVANVRNYFMSLTLIYFLFVVVIFALFSIFNLHNTCTVSFFFYEFKDIPVYTAAVLFFVLGTILSLPFFIRRNKKNVPDAKVLTDINTVELKSEKKKGMFGIFRKKDSSQDGKK